MTERHEKWVRVEPGTVIPAGQPYRIEPRDPEMDIRERRTGNPVQWTFRPATDAYDYFFDSSWKPPLVLPTEPTWGIAVTKYAGSTRLAQWDGDGESVWVPRERYGRAGLLDFIPLTDEQVARIEAAR